MKLYMKTNSPFLQPYIDNLENVDDFDFWADWHSENDGHKKLIDDYYGVERNSDLSIEYHINPKKTYISDAEGADPFDN